MPIIPRSVWEPRYRNGVAIIGTAEWEASGREFWAHHSVTNPPGPNATLEQDCAHMREFEAIGQSSFGAGISYTYVGMPSGRVFEGHSLDRQGTHTYQRNNRSRAYCFAGNYDIHELPNRMVIAAAQTLREVGVTFDGGHRDVYATACPGRYAYARIAEINRLSTNGLPLVQEDDVALAPNELALLQEIRNRTASMQSKGFLEVRSDEVRHMGGDLNWLQQQMKVALAPLMARVDAGFNELTDDEARIIAAVRNQPTGGQVDVDALAPALAAVLAPMLPTGINQADVEEALANVLRGGTDDVPAV